MTWRPPVPVGYLDSVQAFGGLAAPLLAGGSFTLAALALQSAASGTETFSRWPDAALALFLAAGLLQIATVQAAAWTRRYACTPGDLLQWFPGEVTDGEPSAFLLGMQESQLRQAHRWANAARGFYHAGIVALLAGLLLACVPQGAVSSGRWTVLAVCAAGLAGELGWLVRAVFLERGIRREAWRGLFAVLALVVAASVPGVWPGWPVRLAAAAGLLLCALVPGVRRSAGRRPVPWVLSLGLGAIGLLTGLPQPLVVVALLPALLLAGQALADLTRRQHALRG